MNTFTKKMVEILKNAAAIALSEQKQMIINVKSDTSIVTNGDLKVSSFLEKEIELLGYEVFSEENSNKIPKGKKIAIIDPIDGTESYSRYEDTWSILVGFIEDDIFKSGFVFQPTQNKLYFAEKGSGAYLMNTESGSVSRLSASRNGDLIGLCSLKDYGEEVLFKRLNIQEIKRTYSASLKIMEIAIGNADVYANFRKKCSVWDLIAPMVILEESGGTIIYESKFKIDFSNPRVLDKFAAVGPRFQNLKI